MQFCFKNFKKKKFIVLYFPFLDIYLYPISYSFISHYFFITLTYIFLYDIYLCFSSSGNESDKSDMSYPDSSVIEDSMSPMPLFESESLSPLTMDYYPMDDGLDLDFLEEELLGPSFEVAPSLSVCGNIHLKF